MSKVLRQLARRDHPNAGSRLNDGTYELTRDRPDRAHAKTPREKRRKGLRKGDDGGFAPTRFGARAVDEHRAHDGQRRKTYRPEVTLELPFCSRVEEAGRWGGADRRDDREGRRASVPGGTRERERDFIVDTPQLFVR